jgi:hypothetical protein
MTVLVILYHRHVLSQNRWRSQGVTAPPPGLWPLAPAGALAADPP